MTHKAIQPVTHCGSERAEKSDFAGQQIRDLNSKLMLRLQLCSLRIYTIDVIRNVIDVKGISK